MDLRIPTDNFEHPDQTLIPFDDYPPNDSCLCEECDQAEAKFSCTECEQNLCLNCEKRIHNKGARKNHHRTPLTVQPNYSQEGKVSASAKSKQPSLTLGLTDTSPSTYNTSAIPSYYPKQPLRLSQQCKASNNI